MLDAFEKEVVSLSRPKVTAEIDLPKAIKPPEISPKCQNHIEAMQGNRFTESAW